MTRQNEAGQREKKNLSRRNQGKVEQLRDKALITNVSRASK